MGDFATRVLPPTDGSGSFAISGLLMSSAQTLVLRTPELPNVDIPIRTPSRDFRSAALRVRFKPRATLDRSNVCRCLDQDLMAQTCLSIASFLSCLDTNPRSRFFHGPWGSTVPISSLLAKIKEKGLRHLMPSFIPSI
jgi:hypothetical protein